MQISQPTALELVTLASTDLPADVEEALRQALRQEAADSNAARTLQVLLANIDQARRTRQPLCQDTGSLLFWISAPPGLAQRPVEASLITAVRSATAQGILRQNCVDSLTGRNSGDNTGVGAPVFHWEEADSEHMTIWLVLKGGGCENVGRQYSLPCAELEAGRDLEGVRRCVLDAVQRAQGLGCAPGVVAAAIGGDRATGYAASKQLLLNKIGQRNASAELAELERRLHEESNSLQIGPMGFGGACTVLDVFLTALHRVPASFFVSVSYMCWAWRRRGVRLQVPSGEVVQWL